MWFGLHLNVVHGLRQTRLRLVVQPHLHGQIVHARRIVCPNHVARLRGVPVLIGAVEIPFKPVSIGGCGGELQAVAFAHEGGASDLRRQGLSNHNGDLLFVNAAVVLNGEGNVVDAHAWEGQCHRIGIDPRAPVNLTRAAGAEWAAKVPALLALLGVAVVEAHHLGDVPQINGVFRPAKHGGRSVNQGVVSVPNVDVVNGHGSGHPKLRSPTCVRGRQRHLALTSCGEGVVQVIDRGAFV